MSKKIRPTRAALSAELKNVKNDLATHRGLTANAIRQLDEHRQTMEGFSMQLAEMQGVTQTVVDAMIEALGIEDKVREIVARKVEEAKAAREEAAARAAMRAEARTSGASPSDVGETPQALSP